MARILVLCSRVPYPLTGGAKLRLFNTARLLAEEHAVDLLIVDEAPVAPDRVRALERAFDRVTVFDYPASRFYRNTLPGVASRRPLQTFYYAFDEVERWIERNLATYDLAYCNHVRTTEYVRGYSLPKVVDFVDAISRNYANAAARATGLWRAIYPVEARRLLRYERRIADEFDRSFIVTRADRNHVLDGGDDPSFAVLPNGVKPEILDRGPTRARVPDGDADTHTDADAGAGDAPLIVFLGKMDYFPNVDAATFFAESVFPRVREAVPDARFAIVGISPTDDVRRLGRRPGVTVTGFVEDPVDHLERAAVAVAPMRHGAGLQNKVLEAMGMGKPVVTTPLGREGIDAADGDHLRVGETPAELAAAVGALLDDPGERARVGRNARHLIEERYTWEHIRPRLLDPVNELLDD